MITTIKEKYHHVNAIFYEKKTTYIAITFFHKVTKQILKATNTEITQKWFERSLGTWQRTIFKPVWHGGSLWFTGDVK